MLGYLRSRDHCNERLKLGPDEGTLSPASEAETNQLPLQGFYSVVGDRQILFYRWDGELRLRIGDGPPIGLANAQADWSYSGHMGTFILMKEGKRILSETYTLGQDLQDYIMFLKEDIFDPTPLVEPEHFDLFLFVRNVLRKPDRADRIFQGT
jgi:hypothetical protein